MPIQNQFGFQMSSIPQTSFWFWTFLAVSYCKTTQMLQYVMHFYLYTNHERKKIAFSSVITVQIHLFSCEYFLLFSPYFPFSHLSMVVLHKVEDGRAFLYYCNSFAMQLAHVSSYTKGQEISEEFFSCLVQKGNEKFPNFRLSL